MAEKVMVLGEKKRGELRQVTFEALAAAKRIAQDGEVLAVLLGESVQDEAEELIQHGADRVIIVENEALNQYTTDGYMQALLEVYNKEHPEGMVFGHTAIGKDLAPRLAGKLDLGLVSDVVDIEMQDGNVLFTRPIYSGKAFEKKAMKDDSIFVTVRPNNMEELEKDASRNGVITPIEVEIKDVRTVIKDVVKKTSDGIDLAEAKVIVAGGRGVKSAEGFKVIEELADAIGGAAGASRGACDAEYCDYSLQIGQTGKVVTPDLYIAAGISGAIQHLAGMSNSKIIVAINKDPEAPIFEVADYGIVGDLFDIVPKLTEAFKSVPVE